MDIILECIPISKNYNKKYQFKRKKLQDCFNILPCRLVKKHKNCCGK